MTRTRAAVLAATAAVIFSACVGATPPPTACKVGVSWNNYQQERWAKADEPAMKAAIAAGGGEYIRTDARDDPSIQLTDMDSLINQGAKVIILLAKDSVAIQPAVDKAQQANIPVIAYDRLIFDPDTFYITFNNIGVGALMAEEMVKEVPQGNYVIIKGHQADPNATFLRDGMKPHLDPLLASGAIKIVFEEFTDTWRTEKAQENMENALNQNNNDVQAVISENDSMAIGVIAALDRVGLKGTVPVTGQDGDKANLNQVALGNQLVDVWKDAFALGETAGSVAIQLCAGTAPSAVKAPTTLKPHVAPDSPNAAPFTTTDPSGNEVTVQSIILKPTPVKKDNLNLPIELGWITKADACKDVDTTSADAPAACK